MSNKKKIFIVVVGGMKVNTKMINFMVKEVIHILKSLAYICGFEKTSAIILSLTYRFLLVLCTERMVYFSQLCFVPCSSCENEQGGLVINSSSLLCFKGSLKGQKNFYVHVQFETNIHYSHWRKNEDHSFCFDFKSSTGFLCLCKEK